MIQNPKKKPVKVSLFVQTRKMLRDQLCRKFGNRGLRRAWQEYQEQHRGKPKLLTFAVENRKA